MYVNVSTIVCFLLYTSITFGQFPKVEQGDFVSNDSRFMSPVGTSKAGELTIASFNVRNWGAKRRSLNDFEVLADLINEADIVAFQEVGLGIHDSNPELSKKERRRLDAVVSLLKINLGDNWDVIISPGPTGFGHGAESSLLAFRKQANDFTISAKWDKWVDLGPRRDMAVFGVILSKGTENQKLLLGSAHLKPDDPVRGEEMIKLVNWMEQNKDKLIVSVCDGNYGYKENPIVENYKGEKRLAQLHNQGKVFQIFKELSYLKGDKSNSKLRTNMGFRGTGFFYDQILTSPPMASKMADGGILQEDCGIVAYGIFNPHMVRMRERLANSMSYGLDRLVDAYKEEYETDDNMQVMLEKVQRRVSQQADDKSTYIISDHRVIWGQFKMWD